MAARALLRRRVADMRCSAVDRAAWVKRDMHDGAGGSGFAMPEAVGGRRAMP